MSDTSTLRALFDKHASQNGRLTRAGFIAALEQDSRIHSPLFAILFNVVDQDSTGEITFTQFVLFHDLLRKPHAEYEIAFRLFTSSRQSGKLGLDEFLAGWKQYTPDGDVMLDTLKSELLNLYFGLDKDGKPTKKITFEEFSQLLKGLQT